MNLERAAGELIGAGLAPRAREAAALGVLQVHFSGGEPMARRDLLALIGAANGLGLYSNLITSGTLGGAREIEAFAAAGLKHVQLSFQDFAAGERRPHRRPQRRACRKKTRFAAAVRAAGLPLTLNMVVHRQNLDGVPDMIDMALALGARRHRDRPRAVLRLGARPTAPPCCRPAGSSTRRPQSSRRRARD